MSNAVTTPQAKRDIRALIQSDQVKSQLAMVLPKYLTPDRMARVACTAVLKTPKLAECQPESLLQALMLCAQAGLEPDGRNAHLIPYGSVVQVIFDYKGLIALARRNGVQNIATDVVCGSDDFAWERCSDGLNFRHVINWREPRGDMYAAYCIWRDGEQFDGECMTRDEIDAVRKRSKAGNSGPWVTDYNEMAKKTAVRRASKKWPLDPEAAIAMAGDDDVSEVPNPHKVSKPLFAPQLPEATEQPEPEPKAFTEVQASEPAKPNYVAGVRSLASAAKVTEGQVLNYLRSTGSVDESAASLEEAWFISPSAVTALHDDWRAHVVDIKAAK